MMDYVTGPPEAAQLSRCAVGIGSWSALPRRLPQWSWPSRSSDPREVVPLTQGDFSAPFIARQALDSNFTGRLIPSDVLADGPGRRRMKRHLQIAALLGCILAALTPLGLQAADLQHLLRASRIGGLFRRAGAHL